MSDLSFSEAVAAVEAARTALESTMVDAKDAYKANPSPENKAAWDAAVAELQQARLVERGPSRPTQVVGDAFVSNEGEGA